MVETNHIAPENWKNPKTTKWFKMPEMSVVAHFNFLFSSFFVFIFDVCDLLSIFSFCFLCTRIILIKEKKENNLCPGCVPGSGTRERESERESVIATPRSPRKSTGSKTHERERERERSTGHIECWGP